jgi:hypothetical protein
MINTSHWLEIGGGKLLSDSGMQIFPKNRAEVLKKTIGNISFLTLCRPQFKFSYMAVITAFFKWGI